MIEYHCFQVISNLLKCNGNSENFILDLQNYSTLPIDELVGYHAYLNPIMKIISQNDIFYLYDQMNHESFEVREGIKRKCFDEVLKIEDIDFWKYVELMSNHSSEFVRFCSKTFRDCIVQLIRKKAQKKTDLAL